MSTLLFVLLYLLFAGFVLWVMISAVKYDVKKMEQGWADKRAEEAAAKQAEIDALVVGGRYSFKLDNGNPFLKDYQYAYIDVIQNGYVLYHWGNRTTPYSMNQSSSAERFADIYEYNPE